MKTPAERTAPPPGRDVADLLPWYATGTLDAADAARVEAALETDAALVRELELAREELDETITSNEMQRGASPQALDRLFAAIDAETPRRKPVSAGLLDLGSRLAAWLQPKTLAWGGIAAALIIAVQAGFLIDLARNQGNAGYEAASTSGQATGAGTILMVGFQPLASAAEIDALLGSLGATIVEGPRVGLYRLRIGPAGMAQGEIDKTLAALRERRNVVRFAAPGR